MKITDYQEEGVAGKSYKELRKMIESCERCRLSDNRNNAVPGEGPEDAEVVLIGEAPGEQEDEQGRPFVGRAGEKLDECLKKAGLNRDKIFISNVVKCRPPENRDPRKDELKTCHSYTKRLLELIDPKAVGLLGRIPTKQLTARGSITKVRGDQVEKDGRIYIPTFHPAALVYDPSREEKLVKDLKSLLECFD